MGEQRGGVVIDRREFFRQIRRRNLLAEAEGILERERDLAFVEAIERWECEGTLLENLERWVFDW